MRGAQLNKHARVAGAQMFDIVEITLQSARVFPARGKQPTFWHDNGFIA